MQALAQKFREKGATSPDKAMTAQELGLGPRFEEAMKRRLGQTGIFVDTGGKYCLNEARLQEFAQRRQGMGDGYGRRQNPRRSMATIRIVQMSLGILVFVLIIINWLTGRSYDLWLVIVALMVAWIVLALYSIYYLSRARQGMGENGGPWGGSPPYPQNPGQS